ncbi:membrane bound O-acyl transferase family-domain-containing protein [Podospora didyma]|uniref:Membrane bound O-acyl transferase family-domain-containing protein n=1 Tax=Podospora didyma TaxID=330526 RepID=A0AAE0P6N6_9PEZI|nr:membrane bound O-acyl transferase family-domain-containing protein [Podospora didyma]
MEPPRPDNLGPFYLQHYRQAFHAAVAAGEAKPFVIPYTLLGSFFLPALYLCVLHVGRPWLYRLRFAVLAAVVCLNAQVLATTSSANMAVSYATGLTAAWGTIWGFAHLLFMRPQFDAMRVARRRKTKTEMMNGSVGEKTEAAAAAAFAADESLALVADEYEYYWQAYPAEGTFAERWDWVTDHFLSFRGIGWNWAISSVPGPKRPSKPGDLISLSSSSMPVTTRSGYTRCTTYRAFVRNRLLHITWSYLVLDIWTLIFRRDPYFILGPGYRTSGHPLPIAFASLPPFALEILRSVAALLGVLGGLFFYLNTVQLLGCLLSGDPLWKYPSLFGSFSNVLDRGLAGFWGGWWHQSFRVGFTGPTSWLARKGYIPPPTTALPTKIAEAFVAFFLSGLLHSAGGRTAIPDTGRPWGPLEFFLLSFVGVVLQKAVCAVLPLKEVVPRGWRRTGNLAFVVVWLHLTRWALIDDFCAAGLFLFEPVPVSIVRLLGFSVSGESWWRWDMEYLPRWYTGAHWWESGIRL